MSAPKIPGPIREGASAQREVYQLVNALRDRVMALSTSFQVVTNVPTAKPDGEFGISFRYATATQRLYVWDPVALAWQPYVHV